MPEFTKEEITSILDTTGIDGSRRGESLNMEEFALLSNTFYKHK